MQLGDAASLGVLDDEQTGEEVEAHVVHPPAEGHLSAGEETNDAVEGVEARAVGDGTGGHRVDESRQVKGREDGAEGEDDALVPLRSQGGGAREECPADEAEVETLEQSVVAHVLEAGNRHRPSARKGVDAGGEGRPADSEANLRGWRNPSHRRRARKTSKNLVARRRRHIGASGRATMGREDVLISSNEREFIVKALRESELRVDGRGPFDLRPVSYRFGRR